MKSKDIKKDLDRVKTINVLSSSEGGLLMIKSTRKEVLNSLDKLAYNYPTLSHTELLAECANLRARLEMLRLFNSSKKNELIAEDDLKLALEEELES